ncbi:hypothetical protein XT50_000769 [Salmonella enterica subsp. salamae]|nr:hypothetical protein [Salmonella enterica subsp. enterica serovar Abony]EDU9699915.1 hypothetical protein [Salmonella enterica subsp. salamae]
MTPGTPGYFLFSYFIYTLHTSSCLCVGYARSPQSHSYLCSWELTPLPPLSNSNYFGYIFGIKPPHPALFIFSTLLVSAET